MPSPLGELHFALSQEVAWLHLKWNDFRALFAAGTETIELLNATAPAFFSNLQRMLWEDVLMHLCRVTDEFGEARRKREHLTMRRLSSAVTDSELKRQLRPILKQIIKTSEFARDWRNRRLAHHEL